MTISDAKAVLGTTAPAAPPTTAGPHRGAGHARRNRIAWSAAGAVAAVTIAVATFAVVTTGPEDRVQVQQATSTGQDVDSEEFLNRLANQGYIPAEAVDQQRVQLERAVRSGQVPAAALDSRASLVKRLANEGKIPRAAAR